MEGTKLLVLFPTILLHSPVSQTNGKMGQLIFSIYVSSLPWNRASLLMLLLHTLLVPSHTDWDPNHCSHHALTVLGKNLSRWNEFSFWTFRLHYDSPLIYFMIDFFPLSAAFKSFKYSQKSNTEIYKRKSESPLYCPDVSLLNSLMHESFQTF